ncbi:MAG: hypothetical protein ACREAE_09040 [Nitrosopumilaceae archaeon]
MANKESNEEIIRRLDAIIGLLAENLVGSGLIGKGRAIEVLYTAGLSPTEIGKIFHLPTTSIGSIVSRQRKQKRARKKA